MSADELRRLDEVSATPPIYPYWHQRRNNARIPQRSAASKGRSKNA